MNGAYLPSIVTECFCMVFVAVIWRALPAGGYSAGGQPAGGQPAWGREISLLRAMIAAFLVMAVTDLFWSLVQDGVLHPSHLLNAAVNGVCLISVGLGCYTWFLFVEERLCPGGIGGKKLSWALFAPMGVLCLLDAVSIFTGWVFFIDENGIYDEGPGFWVQSVVTFAYLVPPVCRSLYLVIRARQREKRREYLSYVGYMAVCFAGSAAEDYFPTIPVLTLCIFMVILILFLTLYLDHQSEMAKQERELAESRMAVMLSQIQPHFLYNTLVVIQEMCQEKAPEAAETTVEFADFLRGNLSSLSRREPVPFQQELTHTRTYLALEKKRFGERLRVIYDIRTTAFSLPTLTLQPLVENAVQHGVSARVEGGTVRVATDETDTAFTVTVTDDGVGFDPAATADDGRIHVGIANVRGRLAAMCGGTLTLESTPGEGTTAVISLPKGGNSL